MKFIFTTLIFTMVSAINSQEKMTLEEYDAKLMAAREREEIALPKIASLKTKIAALKDEIQTTNKNAKNVWKDILDVVGITQAEYDEFVTGIENLQREIADFESTYGNDFSGWASALKDAETKVSEIKSSRISAIPRVDRMITELDQSLVDSREAMVAAKAAAAASDYSGSVDSFTVIRGNSLWRIAKNSEVFGDPLRWKEIYDANRGKIQNPDLIFPGQVFSIPR